MDNMVPKNILLRLSNDDEKAFEFRNCFELIQE